MYFESKTISRGCDMGTEATVWMTATISPI